MANFIILAERLALASFIFGFVLCAGTVSVRMMDPEEEFKGSSPPNGGMSGFAPLGYFGWRRLRRWTVGCCAVGLCLGATSLVWRAVEAVQ